MEKNKKEPPTEVLDDDFDEEDEVDDEEEVEDEEDENEDLEEEDIDEEVDEPKEDVHDDEHKETKKVQSKEERAQHAKARREREAKEREAREKKIRDEAYLEGKLDGIKVNTFTEEPIEDEYDLFVFETQKQLEKEGKDPIADLPKRMAELNRKREQEAKTKQTEQEQLNAQIDKEFAEFRQAYPDVKITELLKDPDFKDYADGRLGKGGKTLTQLYQSYTKFLEKHGGAKKEEEEEDDGKRGAPSPNGGRKTTKTSYSEMSEEQKIKELRRQGLIN